MGVPGLAKSSLPVSMGAEERPPSALWVPLQAQLSWGLGGFGDEASQDQYPWIQWGLFSG